MKPVNLFQMAERNQVIVEVITSDRKVWVETAAVREQITRLCRPSILSVIRSRHC